MITASFGLRTEESQGEGVPIIARQLTIVDRTREG